MLLRSRFSKLAAFSVTSLLCTAVFAETISSKSIQVKPSRITHRVVLAEDKRGSLRVQVFSVNDGPTGDVSNTLKLILSISRNGDMSSAEANFELASAFSLNSAKRINPGVYQLTYVDTEIGMEPLTRVIDARKAISDIVKNRCQEFTICEFDTTIEMK